MKSRQADFQPVYDNHRAQSGKRQKYKDLLPVEIDFVEGGINILPNEARWLEKKICLAVWQRGPEKETKSTRSC